MSLHNYLNIIKNAVLRKESSVSFKRSTKVLALLKFLSKNGFIRSFELSKNRITVFLKFDAFGNSALNGL
jgi:ribosomal protein S8